MFRKSIATAFAVIALAAGATVARAQDQDKARIKKEIMDKVRAKLDEAHKRILERIERIIDEELAKASATKVDIKKLQADFEELTAKRDELAKQVEAEQDEAAKKALQKKLDKAQDKRDAAGKAYRAAKREMDDADLKKEAQNIPENNEVVGKMQSELIKQLEAKDYKPAILGFKKLYYRFIDMPEIAVNSSYNAACGYALNGDKDEALDWLEMSIDAGWVKFDHLRQDTDLDSLRQERRYKKLMLDK